MDNPGDEGRQLAEAYMNWRRRGVEKFCTEMRLRRVVEMQNTVSFRQACLT